MSSQKIKFGDKEVDKKKFYSSKEAILLILKLLMMMSDSDIDSHNNFSVPDSYVVM